MGNNTKIEWATHTWNPWYGCPDDGRRSPACANCYARSWAKRSGIVDFDREIIRATDKTFYAPLNRNKYKAGDSVFVCSLSDVFHPHVKNQEFIDMMRVVSERPDLRFLFLTKRITGIGEKWHMGRWHPDETPPANVGLGVTVENQEQADIRIPKLLEVPATRRFVSCEPMLGAVDLTRWMHAPEVMCLGPTGECDVACGLDWVICGGESGPGARPMHPAWARSLRDQCQEAVVPFLFKQWGEWAPVEPTIELRGKATMPGQNYNVWAWPDGKAVDGWRTGAMSKRVGKKSAGRELDGKTWDEFPEGE